jgi:hypothetical protein
MKKDVLSAGEVILATSKRDLTGKEVKTVIKMKSLK